MRMLMKSALLIVEGNAPLPMDRWEPRLIPLSAI